MLDNLVGNITQSLKTKGLYDSTVFVFSSDNGGISSAQVGNYPYRGICFDNIVMSGQKPIEYFKISSYPHSFSWVKKLLTFYTDEFLTNHLNNIQDKL